MTTYYATLSVNNIEIAWTQPSDSMSGATISALNLEDIIRGSIPALRGRYITINVHPVKALPN